MGIINKIVVHQYIKILNNSENSSIFLPQVLCYVDLKKFLQCYNLWYNSYFSRKKYALGEEVIPHNYVTMSLGKYIVATYHNH